MTVLEFANKSIEGELRNNDLLRTRLMAHDGCEEELIYKIKDSDNVLKYWSAYIDGVKAQIREQENLKEVC